MQLSKSQKQALENTPLELKETFEGSASYKYYDDNNDSYIENSIRILKQFGYIREGEASTVKITDKGRERLNKYKIKEEDKS